jgi:hypothetical protein
MTRKSGLNQSAMLKTHLDKTAMQFLFFVKHTFTTKKLLLALISVIFVKKS